MAFKRKLSNAEKSKIIDLCAQRFPRTVIAKKMGMKNATLERLCEEESIPLTSKGHHAYTKFNASGIYLAKGRNLHFRNLNELHELIKLDLDPMVHKIDQYGDTFKVTRSGEIRVGLDDKSSLATNEMIEHAVSLKKIKFISEYLNRKFGANYDL